MTRILSIDGGGILGLIPAVVLAEIEARTGRMAAELFDLVAGTSTGGIVACAVAAGVPAAEVAGLYRDRGREIFSSSWGRRMGTAFGLVGPQYGAAGLEAALADVFGDRRLSEVGVELLVPAYDIEARCPVLFKSSKARRDGRRDFLLRDVARATSAGASHVISRRGGRGGGGRRAVRQQSVRMRPGPGRQGRRFVRRGHGVPWHGGE